MSTLHRELARGASRLILVTAPPRTAATAVALSLLQSPDIDLYIHEPFANGYCGSPDVSAGNRIIQAQLLRLQKAIPIAGRTCPQLLIKETSMHLRAPHFARLCRSCSTVIVVVRCPLLQVTSLARLCKWASLGQPDRFRFTHRELAQKKAPAFCGKDDMDYFVRDAWQAIARQVAYLRHIETEHDSPPPAWCIVDGEISRADRGQTSRSTARVAGIRFHDGMVTGWTRDKRANLIHDGWSARAAEARQLHHPQRHTCALDEFPRAWHRTILAALDTYVSLLALPEAIRPRSAADVGKILSSSAGKGVVFADAQPVTSYALAATLPGESRAKRSLLDMLRRRAPHHEALFDAIETHASSIP